MQDAIILYENGKAIGGEGHLTNASDITFENTGTDLVSENVEGAIKEVNDKKSDKATVLWENPSPTASFSAQNITLDSSDYDILDWYYLVGSVVCAYSSIVKGYNGILMYCSGRYILSRQCVRTSDTVFTVNDAYRHDADNSTEAVDNTVCVPIKVIGRKL